MLQPTERFEYIPYVPAWYEPRATEAPWSDADSRIIDYVQESHALDIQRIRPSLLDELDRSEAPYSNMHTACALETYDTTTYERGLYLGHREEQLDTYGDLQVITALQMALGKIGGDEEKVVGVYLTGRDLPEGKLKRMMPLPSDYDHLSKRFDDEWGPTFLLIPPDSYGWPALQGLRWVWASNHAKAYSKHEYENLMFVADDIDWILSKLYSHSKLKPKDAQFVAEFTQAAVDSDWTAFFTGSASGRGEITPALTDQYDDMDFILVAEKPEEAEREVVALAEQHYGKLTKVPEVAYDTYGGKKIKGFFLYDQTGKKLIQLAVGKTMDEVCFRTDVIERNSGLWLNDCRIKLQ